MGEGTVECFRQRELNGSPAGEQSPGEASAEGLGEEGEGALVCWLCHAVVTGRGEAVDVDGSHEHTFFNPAGVLFEIGCFGAAPGCVVTGEATEEFSWFAGYRWRFAGCAGCGAHLGWRFDGAAGGGFFGLITSRIVEIEGPREG